MNIKELINDVELEIKSKKNDKIEVILKVKSNKVVEEVEKCIKSLSPNTQEYADVNNDDLYNDILLRILVEIIREKITLEPNVVHIVETNISGNIYKFSVTNVKNNPVINGIIYGLIM